MNKMLREDMEYLMQCDDKAITPDIKDDAKMTLDYIDELEKENNEWSMIFDTFSKRPYAHRYLEQKKKELGDKNIIGLDSEMIYKDYYDCKSRLDKAIEYIDRMTRAIDYDDDELITWEHIIDIENILRGKNDE